MVEQEKVLFQFLSNYDQKQLISPDILYNIYFELFTLYYKNENISETIKYGEKAFEIYQKENYSVATDLKVIFSTLIDMYGRKGDNLNHDKFEKLQYANFSEDEENDYYSELDRLIKAEDFNNFKIKFDQYEEILISKSNYDDLLEIYSFTQLLFERNILFKKKTLP